MKFEGTLTNPCYEDENGNIISVIEQENDFLVARISKEGDVEHIEAFTDIQTATKMLHSYCEKQGYKAVKSNKLGYAFTWSW